MRFSAISIFTLGGLLATAAANPLAVRQNDAAVSSITDLLATVQTFTGAINATLATITAASSDDDKAAAVASIGAELNSITSAVQSTTAAVGAPAARKRSINARQIPTLTAALVAVLNEVFATVDGIVASLGLSALLGFLNPLTGSLGGLILAVEVLVDSLLLAVTVLLNTLLTDLSITLGGL